MAIQKNSSKEQLESTSEEKNSQESTQKKNLSIPKASTYLTSKDSASSLNEQKEIRTKINQESTISWEKFCNSISLESDPKKSWRKITNFLQPKGPRSYPTLKLGNKTAKTNPEKAQLFAESVERNVGIESHLFSKSQFDRINKFVEAHSYHFTPLNSLYDNITDTDDDSDLVADVDPDTLIRIVRTEQKMVRLQV